MAKSVTYKVIVDSDQAVSSAKRAEDALNGIGATAQRAGTIGGVGVAALTSSLTFLDRSVSNVKKAEEAIQGVGAAAKTTGTVGSAAFFSFGSSTAKLLPELKNVSDAALMVGSRGSTGFWSLTSSIVAGQLAAGALVGAIRTTTAAVKELTVGSGMYAARTEQLGIALDAVAKSNDIASSSAHTMENRLKQLGITTQDSRQSLAQLTAANIDYRKAAELARLSQDLGRVAGLNSSETFDRLTHAIATQNSHMFRFLGLNLTAEQAFDNFARTTGRSADSLSELEKKQILVNEVLRVGAGYAGTYEASLGTAGGQMLSMDRYLKELKNTLGEQFLPSLTLAVQGLSSLAKNGQDSIEWIVQFSSAMNPAIGTLNAFNQSLAAYAMIGKEASEADARRLATTVASQKMRETASRELREQQAMQDRQRDKARELAEKDRKAIEQAEKSAHKLRMDAQEKEVTGLGKIVRERLKLLDLYGKSAKAISDINTAFQASWAKEMLAVQIEQRKLMGDQVKTDESRREKDLEYKAKRWQDAQDYARDTLAVELESNDKQLEERTQMLQYAKDAELRLLDSLNAQTLKQKLWVEQRRSQIDEEYYRNEAVLHAEAIGRRMAREINYLENLKKVRPELESEINQRIAAVTEQNLSEIGRVEKKWQADSAAARENSAIRSQQLVYDRNRQIFESFKQQAGGVFDSLLTKSQSVWSALGNSLKTAMLTAIKDVVTSRIAVMLMQLFTGQRVALAGGQYGGGFGSGSGILSGLGGLLGIGASPVFGSASVVGGPGGTSGFSGAVGGRGGMLGGLLGGGYGGGLSGLSSFLGIGGSVSTGAGSATTWGSATLGQKLSSIGKSEAALMAGGMIALDGLRRGGGLGMLESTGGGALVGYKFGGPLGAAIGAGVGAIAGGLRWLFGGESQEEKARKKIKALYGVDIPEKDVLSQIVAMAKQSYGGNLDLAIRSPQVHEFIDIYSSMSTGKSLTNNATPQSMTVGQSASGIFEVASYKETGEAVYGGLGAAAIDSVAAGVAGTAGATPVVIQLDGQATTQLLQGVATETVAKSGRLTVSAVVSALKSNAGRFDMAAAQIAPGTIIG